MTPRSERRSEDVRGVFNKSWNDEFGSDRRPLDKSYLQEKQEQSAWTDDGYSRPYTEDLMTLFTQDYTEDGPLSQVTDVLNSCRGVSPRDLDNNGIPQRRAAWLDDTAAPTTRHNKKSQTAQGKKRRRKNKYQNMSPVQPGNQTETSDERAKGTYRLYDGPLSASELRNYLKEERFFHPNLPDADRRLIFISSPDPYYLLVLAETARTHQVPALREGIWKYISRQTSIKGSVSVKRYLVFQLELHLPFFALRQNKYKSSDTIPRPGKLQRKWTDLSFVATEDSTQPERNTSGIYDAQVSLFICGSDEKRWIAYCFVDNDFDEDAELGDDNFSHDGMMADPITDGGVDANMPIFDPREYFLMAFLVWIGKVFEESRSLVGAVENGIEEFVKAHPPFKILLKQGQINDEFLHISQWESRTFDLLKRLLGNLSNLLVVWDRFSGPNGDIHYFTDLRTASPRTRTHISGLLVGIAEKFAELEDLKQKLKELEDRCRTYQADSQHNERVLMVLSHQISHRSIQLMVESNHAAERSGTATDITILVLPFALVSAFFSIPGDDMSFKRTPRSFVIAVFGFTIGIQVFLWLSRNRRIQHKTGKPTEESEDVTEVHTLDIGNIANGYWNFPTFRRKPLDSETAGIV